MPTRRLQGALEGATARFRNAREKVLAELPDVDLLRDHFKAVRSATLAGLAEHLETFERNALAAGAQVHWAGDAAAAQRIVLEIAQQHGVQLIAKSKSMATEEIHLNQALSTGGVEPVETDLGEWIIQLAGDPPYHIVAPAIHKTRQQVAAMFSELTGEDLPADDIPRLTAVARRLLREKFLAAGMGVSGGNVAVAETGSVVLVTNEGNGRMVTSLPKVHVAVVGIEKIAPTWDDAAAWLALLARSGTGQPLSVYTTVVTGPARSGDPDGPQEVHIVLLDNGRSRLAGGPFEESLQCIRCSACLNICPVYREAGGHAYGSPYSGPIGAVISPLLFGLEEYQSAAARQLVVRRVPGRVPGAHRPAAHAARAAGAGGRGRDPELARTSRRTEPWLLAWATSGCTGWAPGRPGCCKHPWPATDSSICRRS